jgi:hypothetical protein
MLYIHTTNKKINKIKNTKQSKLYMKSNGLWYAKKDIWLNWSKHNMKKDYKYLYSIKVYHTNFNNLDKTKVLLIKSVKDFTDFSIKYGKKENKTFDSILINWVNVSKDFGGIEIKNIKKLSVPNNKLLNHFDMDKNNSLLWINSFDIDSGCVWNKLAMDSFQEMN